MNAVKAIGPDEIRGQGVNLLALLIQYVNDALIDEPTSTQNGFIFRNTQTKQIEFYEIPLPKKYSKEILQDLITAYQQAGWLKVSVLQSPALNNPSGQWLYLMVLPVDIDPLIDGPYNHRHF